MDQKRGPVSRETRSANAPRKRRLPDHVTTSPTEIAATDLKLFMSKQEGTDALALLAEKNSWIEFGSKMVGGGEITYCLTNRGLRCYDAGSGLPSRPTGRAAPPPGKLATLEEVAAIYTDPATSCVPNSSLSIVVFIKQALVRVRRRNFE